MAVTEETRHRLYQRLEQVLGAEEATTLMELVPPVGWGDVATKRDLDVLGERMARFEGRMDRFEVRMDRFDGRMDGFDTRLADGFERIHRDMRLQLYWLLGFLASAAGVALAVLGR